MNAYDNIKEVYKIKGITSYEEIDSLLDKVGLLKEKNKKVRTFLIRNETKINDSLCPSRQSRLINIR